MLKINLVPHDARKPTSSPLAELHRTPLMRLIIAGMMLVAALQALPIMMRKRQLRELRGTIEALVPKKAELDQLQRMLYRLQVKERAFQQFDKEQGGWAARLNGLSDLTPDGVWFHEFVLDAEQGLIIQGLAIGQGGTEMVSIGRLVQDLKAHPDFAAAVQEIQIESIKRTQDRDMELVQFTLTCPLVEGILP
jgi:Tfp pilus assembly protein PilN